MKIIFQVIYPVAYIDRQLDSKIRKIFDYRTDGKNYVNSSSSGFGVREIEAECKSDKDAPGWVIQNIEDDLKTLFAQSTPKLKLSYSSTVHECEPLLPEHSEYSKYRTISFKFTS